MSEASREDKDQEKITTIITLLGRDQAREGHRFIYSGPMQECRECQLKNICFNLEKGRRYRVVKVRDKEHKCSVFSNGVKVVEIEQVHFHAGVSKSMVVEGSVIKFQSLGCGILGCENWFLTHPPGVDEGTRIKVLKILGDVKCSDDSVFKEALVDFAD